MIAILDYSTSSVLIIKLPDYVGEQSEDIEQYLTEELGYNLDEIHWMNKIESINITTLEL